MRVAIMVRMKCSVAHYTIVNVIWPVRQSGDRVLMDLHRHPVLSSCLKRLCVCVQVDEIHTRLYIEMSTTQDTLHNSFSSAFKMSVMKKRNCSIQ